MCGPTRALTVEKTWPGRDIRRYDPMKVASLPFIEMVILVIGRRSGAQRIAPHFNTWHSTLPHSLPRAYNGLAAFCSICRNVGREWCEHLVMLTGSSLLTISSAVLQRPGEHQRPALCGGDASPNYPRKTSFRSHQHPRPGLTISWHNFVRAL